MRRIARADAGSRRARPLAATAALAAAVLLAASVPAGCRGGAGAGAAGAGMPPEEVVLMNARGAAMLGQEEIDGALERFREAAAKRPGDPVILSNLGLALMLKGQFDEAEKALRDALAADPDFLPAHFRLGVNLKNRGEVDGAIAAFERVAAEDPHDVVTWYQLGSLRARRGDLDAAVADFRKALDLDPTHISTLYGMGRALIQNGETEAGTRFLDLSQKIREETGLGETVGLQYGEQGKYSLATEYPAGSLAAPDEIPVTFAASALPGEVVLVCDADGDGRPDLLAREAVGGRLLMSREDGLKPGPALPETALLPGPAGTALAGDLDNDGTMDLLLAGGGAAPRVWKGSGDGRFEDVTASAGLPASGAPLAALLSDVDHDGDLDVVLALSSPEGLKISFHVNAGSARFSPRNAVEVALPRPADEARLAATDFDNDRDVDLIVATGSGRDRALRFLSNRRDGSYDSIDLLSGVGAGSWETADFAIADLDKDGWMDIVAAGRGAGPLRVLLNRGGRTVEPAPGPAQALPPDVGEAAAAVTAFDFDNDGFLDIALAPSGGGRLLLLRNLGAGRWEDATARTGIGAATPEAPAARLAAADIDGDGDLDLVAGGALLRNDGGEKARWAAVRPRGIGDNRFGAGTKVEFRSGLLWQKFEAGPDGLPVHMGLGSRDRLDGVRLVWPGGVLQDEIDVVAGRAGTIAQLDRKGTSCPILYAWDGSAVRFVTDFLGGSAIGYRTGAESWNTPDTDEYVKIPGERLAARDGLWDIRMVNQLEETIFFDRAELLVVDHPEGTEIFPDERLMPAPPFPPFRILVTRGAHPPLAARDGEGRDVLDLLLEEDRRTVDGFRLEPFKGYARPHDLVLSIGDVRGAEQVVLLMDGWIDYADSTSNLAAAQAGLALQPPRLDARRPGGEWRTVLPSMGFPAGLPKTMTVDLTGLLGEGESEIRIATSMRIYWDRIRVATAGAAESVRVARLDPAGAELRHLGFPLEFSPDGRRPRLYDYSRLAPASGWKAHTGAYTRFGDVRELLVGVDDFYVVTRAGDEVALTFDASAVPPPPAGWRRDFLLYADGFGKDMDVNSARPDAVGPLPWHGMPSYPWPAGAARRGETLRRERLARWNTRIVPADPLGRPGAAPAPIARLP